MRKSRLTAIVAMIAAGVLHPGQEVRRRQRPGHRALRRSAVGRLGRGREDHVEAVSAEFLVEFKVGVPDGTPSAEVEQRTRAEASAAAKLVDDGHLLRLWRRDATTTLGLYAAASEAELDGLLRALPLADWMQITVTPLAAHPNDPAAR